MLARPGPGEQGPEHALAPVRPARDAAAGTENEAAMIPARAAIAAVIALGLLAACQDPGRRSMRALPPGSDFAVVAINGRPAPEGVTMRIGADGRVSGRTPCNHYTGQLTERYGAIAVSGMVVTRMACADPERDLAENRFTAAMGVVTAAGRTDGAEVVLTDAEGRERLRLRPAD